MKKSFAERQKEYIDQGYICNVIPVQGDMVTVLAESEGYKTPIKNSHAADAIKDKKYITMIVDYLTENERYRDLLLFVMGINFGLRCGDLTSLRIGDVITPEGKIVNTFEIIEEKTKKRRPMAMNESVLKALTLYLKCEYGDNPVDRRDYLFTSNSNRKGRDGAPLTVRSIERLLKSIVNDELHIPVHASTHMLRKTFAYHFLMAAPDRNRALELLSMQLNHSSIAYTLRYIGITQDEILDTCFRLDLGFENEPVRNDNVVSLSDARENLKDKIVQA